MCHDDAKPDNCDLAPAASGPRLMQDRFGETLLRVTTRPQARREPRVCSMVRASTPEDEDRRQDLPVERKVLIMERVQHVNRIKGLLFSQGASGYEPLRRDRRRLDALQTGDGRRLPQHLKAQVCRELDRLELLLEQIKAVEAERDALLRRRTNHSVGPAADVAGRVRGRWAGVRLRSSGPAGTLLTLR